MALTKAFILLAGLVFIAACSSVEAETPPLAYTIPIMAPTLPIPPMPPTPIEVEEILVEDLREIVPDTLTILTPQGQKTWEVLNKDGINYVHVNDFTAALPGYVEIPTTLVDGDYIPLAQTAAALDIRVERLVGEGVLVLEAMAPPATTVVFKAQPIPLEIQEQITGVTYHPNPHLSFEDLAYLTVTHVDFQGHRRHGHLIVGAHIAEEVLDIFRDIYEAAFPIARIRLIDYYLANDYFSMADNNSSAFNFRYIANTTRLSRHAWGMAIDINPIQNPVIIRGEVWPELGNNYLDRGDIRSGMIVPGDAVYNAFTSRGWIWGGHWSVPIDYHHFERR